jgi:hypothetical protein
MTALDVETAACCMWWAPNALKPVQSPDGQAVAGILQLRACLEMRSSDAHLHLFGFNWSPRHWETHMVAAFSDTVICHLYIWDATD